MSEVITKTALTALVTAWIAGGKTVSGPTFVKEGLCLYDDIPDAGRLALKGFIRPGDSIKKYFLPRHEELYRYKFTGQETYLENIELTPPERVIVGARPCDAASLPVLDKVFNWDYIDEFYTRRRNATAIVTIACTAWDDQCFCTSVGLGPASEKGSDVLLLPLENGYEVRCLTDKGKALFEGKTTPSENTAAAPDGPERKFDTEIIAAFLREGYEHPVWRDIALRCLGCGACAYTCPTCHCFDITDEGNARGGSRVKNWDCCQFNMFTMHASGHNPRSNQAQRQRQRIQHKFRIYPDKFDEILCTGCGNCTRNCPVGLGVLTTMEEIAAHGAGRNAAENAGGLKGESA